MDQAPDFDEFIASSIARGVELVIVVAAPALAVALPAVQIQATDYVALCAYPSRDGGMHLQKGMFAAVEVGPSASGATSTSG
jgi:hypothetical protein